LGIRNGGGYRKIREKISRRQGYITTRERKKRRSKKEKHGRDLLTCTVSGAVPSDRRGGVAGRSLPSSPLGGRRNMKSERFSSRRWTNARVPSCSRSICTSPPYSSPCTSLLSLTEQEENRWQNTMRVKERGGIREKLLPKGRREKMTPGGGTPVPLLLLKKRPLSHRLSFHTSENRKI